MKTIAVLFADGFEEIEAIAIVDVLRRAEFTVLMAGIAGLSATGAHGIQVTLDTRLADLDAESLDMVVLPGGIPGATNLRDDPAVIALLKQTAAAGKHVAAICAAPIALQAAGLLAGRKVTCYPAFVDHLQGATQTAARVQVDGRVITGKGAGTAIDFALQLVAELGRPDLAESLAVGMIAKTA